jgi:hypothetical protein
MNRRFQLEDDKTVIEAHHFSFEDAMEHLMRLKKRSHRNRQLKIYETTNNMYVLKRAL